MEPHLVITLLPNIFRISIGYLQQFPYITLQRSCQQRASSFFSPDFFPSFYDSHSDLDKVAKQEGNPWLEFIAPWSDVDVITITYRSDQMTPATEKGEIIWLLEWLWPGIERKVKDDSPILVSWVVLGTQQEAKIDQIYFSRQNAPDYWSCSCPPIKIMKRGRIAF